MNATFWTHTRTLQILAGLALFSVVSCGYDNKLPDPKKTKSEDAIDLSFGKPRPGFMNRTFLPLDKLPAGDKSHQRLSLANNQLIVAGALDKSLVSEDEGLTFKEIKPLEVIPKGEWAFVMPDRHFWYVEGRTLYRSRPAAKNPDGSLQKLQLASLTMPPELGELKNVLGFTSQNLFLEYAEGMFVVVTFTSDGTPHNGELKASNLVLLPAFLAIQAPTLAAGILPDASGYWLSRGPYVAVLTKSEVDPSKPFTWQLYDNHIKINSQVASVHMALTPVLSEDQWTVTGRTYALTADAFWRSQTAAELKPSFSENIKAISSRACEICHEASDPLDTEELWLSHKDQIKDRIKRPVGDPLRMPPKGARGFTQDDRDMILEYFKSK